uniref:Uncharacterized protein n=1 Tax=Zooxanthella nutricula TaxID=1333877 RepID=A0A7S2Q317_9DINO
MAGVVLWAAATVVKEDFERWVNKRWPQEQDAALVPAFVTAPELRVCEEDLPAMVVSLFAEAAGPGEMLVTGRSLGGTVVATFTVQIDSDEILPFIAQFKAAVRDGSNSRAVFVLPNATILDHHRTIRFISEGERLGSLFGLPEDKGGCPAPP